MLDCINRVWDLLLCQTFNLPDLSGPASVHTDCLNLNLNLNLNHPHL